MVPSNRAQIGGGFGRLARGLALALACGLALAGGVRAAAEPGAGVETLSDPRISADETTGSETAAVGPALRGIDVERRDGALVLHLRADRPIEDVESFALEHPDRLVIDLPGARDATTQMRFEIGEPRAARARVGAHDDKVRVVVDAGDAPDAFAWHRIESSEDGLRVTLAGPAEDGSAPDAGAAATAPIGDAIQTGNVIETAVADDTPATAPATPEPHTAETADTETAATETAAASPDEAPDEALAANIYAVEIDRTGARDRVTIAGDAPSEWRVLEPAPDTVMVVLEGARLEREAEGSFKPEGEGPVARVSVFEQPEVEGDEVRVVITRPAGLTPDVSAEGTLLHLDFPDVSDLASATGPPAASVPAALAPDGSVSMLEEGGFSEAKVYAGRRISLDFKDVDINDVLRLIAEVSDLNIIAGDEVQGNVTIRLVDVPWDQALDVILLTKGLGFDRVGNVLRIAPSDLLKQEEEARLQERRAKEKLEDLVVKLQPVNYADVGEVEQMVKRLLTERGTVNTDKRTNTLILKDIPSVIDEATALVKSIDTQTPQVLIESKIVEASLDYSRELGSQWGIGFQPFVDAFDSGSGDRRDGGGNDFRLNNEQQFFGGNPFGSNNVIVQNPISSVANGLLDIGAFLIGEKYNLEILLEAAESNGEGKVISSPRVVTLDNREALIEQGVSIPFQTFENGDAQLEFIDAVLSLKVTPHITADKSIIMKIEVTRNAPDGSVPTPTGSPAIAKNQARTETLVKDGQTLVLGGIYVVDKGEARSSVPFLWQIPIIGHAFRNSEVRDIRKELLIFVTPRIVKRAEVAAN